MNSNPTITLAWITRRGAHWVETIDAAELEPRIKKLYKQRCEAVAWLGDNRADVIGAVTPPNGGKLSYSPHAFWSWWLESAPYGSPVDRAAV